jgi:hypothetical protein
MLVQHLHVSSQMVCSQSEMIFEKWWLRLEHNNIQTDLIIMDFAKAFDKVPHQRPLYKLKFYGIVSQDLECLKPCWRSYNKLLFSRWLSMCFVMTCSIILQLIQVGVSPHPVIPSLTITSPGIQKLLNNINPHKVSGPDNISGRILKDLQNLTAPILTIIFQRRRVFSVSIGY